MIIISAIFLIKYWILNNRLIKKIDSQNNKNKYNKIVISPGPGNPNQSGNCLRIVKKLHRKIPILGVCLGFQQILYAEGGKIIQQNKIFHGYQSVISILPSSKLFKNIKNLYAGRYHSLKLQEPFNSNTVKITMRCKTTNVAMALEDHTNNVFGFQFHPDSFLTKNGRFLIQKILSA